MRTNLTRLLDQILLAFLGWNGFADFLTHVPTFVPGNDVANRTSDLRAFLGGNWNAGFLLVHTADLLREVGAFFAVDASLARNKSAVINWFLVTSFARNVVTLGFGFIHAFFFVNDVDFWASFGAPGDANPSIIVVESFAFVAF